MNELYHAKRSHKYVAKVKGAGKGGRPLYFYSMAAYRSFMNGLKEKTGRASQERTRKYESLAENSGASYRLNRSLNRQAKSDMTKSSNLNRFHSTRAATATEKVDTHTSGMKAVMKMTNNRKNSNGMMNGKEAGEYARQHLKATSAARAKKAHSEGKDAAATKYKASNAWKEATSERANNAYNKTILAQKRAHQARQEYEKTLPGKLEKASRKMDALPKQWKRNAAVGVESIKRTLAGNKEDKYNSWKLNKAAENAKDVRAAKAYRDRAAKFRTRYGGSATGAIDNAVSSVKRVFKKKGSTPTSTIRSPSSKAVQTANGVVYKHGNRKIRVTAGNGKGVKKRKRK